MLSWFKNKKKEPVFKTGTPEDRDDIFCIAVEHGGAKERNYQFFCFLYEQKYPEIRKYEIST